MRLILIRHAKAEKYGTKKDFDRTLAEKGVKQCERLGLKLKELDLGSLEIHYSAALRTTETYKNLKSYLKVAEAKSSNELYNASLHELLKYIWKMDCKTNTFVMIAHNPGISNLCTYFLDDDKYFKTAACAIIDFELDGLNELSKGTGDLTQFLQDS